jgi:hypothetical protein
MKRTVSPSPVSRPPRALVGFLRPYDRDIRNLALGLREVVLAELAPCHENIYDAYSAVAIGYGPTDRVKDGIVHIAVYSKHVNLGFNKGATLPDPAGLLKGTGTSVRHITLKSLGDLAKPEIRAYVCTARASAGANETPRPRVRGIVSVVKRIYARKRRPR